ncbi:MAG: DNA-binding protein [Oscillospiraceae bacterium]
MDRKYYVALFERYSEVVTLDEFKEMLGGIADSTARKLIRENRVKHYYIRCTYLIPKEWVIEYVLSKHYASYKKSLKVQV